MQATPTIVPKLSDGALDGLNERIFEILPPEYHKFYTFFKYHPDPSNPSNAIGYLYVEDEEEEGAVLLDEDEIVFDCSDVPQEEVFDRMALWAARRIVALIPLAVLAGDDDPNGRL